MDEATTPPTCQSWCVNHEDPGYGCASEPITVAGVTSWVITTSGGRTVAVIGDIEVDAAGLADLGERVTLLRGLVGSASRPAALAG